MTPRELDRTRHAAHLLASFGGNCWVCVNRGHHHLTGKCSEDRCPCARRGTWPHNPVWASAARGDLV
jgi:hypothetical protein